MPRRTAAANTKVKYDESSDSDDSFTEHIPKKSTISKTKRGLKGN